MKTIKIKVFARTNKVGSECEDIIEFSLEDWEGMSEEEQEDACREAAFENLEWGWRVIDDGNP